MRESSTRFSLSHKNLSKLVNLLTSALLFSLPSHRCTRSSSRITLSCPSLTSRLKIANRSFYHSAPVLWNMFNFFRHYKSPPFHTVICIHLISLSYHILDFCHFILVLWTKCYVTRNLLSWEHLNHLFRLLPSVWLKKYISSTITAVHLLSPCI